MKKTIITVGLLTACAAGVNAQGIVAGWDFADVPSLDTVVNGYAAEHTSFNNGVATTGSISTTLAQDTEVSFAANGFGAGLPQFNDGFDTTTTDGFGGAETGQQSLNVRDAGEAFDIVFNFTDAYDVVINADWLTSATGGAADILNISYSSDGGETWTTYDKADGGYVALASTSDWTRSTGDAGGFLSFASAQQDMIIDLSSVSTDEFTTINAVRFEFENLSATERLGLDNVHIAGTAVAEPQTQPEEDGSLFILENADSSELTTDWYETPMGDLYTASAPWLWSNDYGWMYSSESNTTEAAYVYIESAPFEGWVYVDQASASSLGYWGYAFDASEPDLNGWFWFFNTESTEDEDEYFIWDFEGQSSLTFSDSAE